MRGGIVLPESAEVADLPSADGPGSLFEARVGSEAVGDGPAAHTGAVSLEREAAKQFAGNRAVGRWRRRGEQLGGQSNRLRRPDRVVIAT